MRTAAICPTCATYENALCILYNGEYLSTIDVAPLDSLEIALENINTVMSGITGTSGTSGSSGSSGTSGLTGSSGSSGSSGSYTPTNASAGTYTPTITGISNVASSTPYSSLYMRINNEVHVQGSVQISNTIGATVIFTISLPIASDFTDTKQLSGVTITGNPVSVLTQFVTLEADITSNTAYLSTVSSGTNTIFFSFIYTIA